MSRIGRLLGPSNPGDPEALTAVTERVPSRSGPQEDDVSSLFRTWLGSLNAEDVAVFGAGLLGVLVVYLGMAMSTALFHHDRSRRLIALEIFRDLLSVLSRRPR
jgi:hypothetical protein